MVLLRMAAVADMVAHSVAVVLRIWVPLVGSEETSLATGNELAIVDLIEAIENDRPPVSSAADAVDALEMILGTYESHITGSRVTIPLANRNHPLVSWQ